MNPQIVEARNKLNAKAAAHREFLEKGKVDGKWDPVNSELKMDGQKFHEKVESQQKELKDLRDDLGRLEKLEQAEEQAKSLSVGSIGGEILSAGSEDNGLSLGDVIVKGLSIGKGTTIKHREIDLDLTEVQLKALMSTTAGFAPQAVRTDVVSLSPQRPAPLVVNYIPTESHDQVSYVFMEETTFTNAAAETAEGGTFPEAALEYTERSEPIRKIAVWLPVTDEQLEDVQGIRSQIDNRLRLMLAQRIDAQVLSGNGTAPNVRGLLNVAGIQTRAKGADSIPDAICRIITTIESDGYANPNVIFMHPQRWQDVMLLKTADGAYIWGHPSLEGPLMLFGVPVVKTTALANTTAVVGDFAMHSKLAIKRGVTVEISNSHDQFFIQGKQAIRLDTRLTPVFIRPKAFGTVTGLNN